ncbi:hypothetical protein L4X63_02865 [Geomonas sp. Red32]|uniref:DUF4870 family protein n=1 Tax=Geomonas sp. Red32 TaxID=2912856 RepID=UPI00202CDE16|nr:hypothetical protein [Geomonas sp. Red32]MCM0080523.1 hypothetical protein [Geomonas sp. Red32]
MDGVVLGYDAEEGIIRGSEGARYRFTRTDWKSSPAPAAGLKVDFVAVEDRATEIYVINPATGAVFSTVSTIERSEKIMPTVVYLCYLASFLYGFTMVIGVFIAFYCRDRAAGTWYQSHFDYQIAIFWKSFAGFLFGLALTFVFGLGIIILLFTYAWVIFKIIKGWKYLTEGIPVPA